VSTIVPAPAKRSAAQIVTPVLLLLGAMWALEILDWILPGNWDFYGIQSRSSGGLLGILAAPFLHQGFDHLLANTIPFLILGTLVSWRAQGKFWWVALVIIVVSGFGVWLLAPADVITIGASGMVFGFLGYLLAAGVLARHWTDVLIAVAVLLIYGSMLAGALPFGVPAGVSWLMHLTGALSGILAAFLFVPPRDAGAKAQA
jgi:membrane associated rhomboid family serine protease